MEECKEISLQEAWLGLFKKTIIVKATKMLAQSSFTILWILASEEVYLFQEPAELPIFQIISKEMSVCCYWWRLSIVSWPLRLVEVWLQAETIKLFGMEFIIRLIRMEDRPTLATLMTLTSKGWSWSWLQREFNDYNILWYF